MILNYWCVCVNVQLDLLKLSSCVCAAQSPVCVCVFQMEMKDEIDDDEVTLPDFIDSKMEGWQMEEVEKMYDVASQCLCEKKNRRPTITQVCVCGGCMTWRLSVCVEQWDV